MAIHDSRTRTTRTHVQMAAMGIAAVFLLVGALGFVPAVTTSYDQLEVAGRGSGAHLLGMFQVSVLHNGVHLVFGVVGLVAARSHNSSRGFLIGGGVVYLVLWLYGTVIDHGSMATSYP